MSIHSVPRLNYSLKFFSQVASAIVILIGCLVLVGWMYNITIFKSVLPGLVNMKANTALNFILAGVSLWISQPKQANKSGIRRYMLQACVSILLLISVLTLIEYLLGWNLGIDQLWFKEPLKSGTLPPGRMSPYTALCFLLVGFVLLLLNRRRGYRLVQWLTLVSAFVTSVALVGYIYGVTAFYGDIPSYYTSIAFHTALAFTILSVGILLACPDGILVKTILTSSAGGVIARRLLPAAISVPLVLGWLFLKAQKAGIYDIEFGVSLFVVSNIVIFVILIWWNARLLNRAEAALLSNQKMLQIVIDLIPQSIWWKDSNSKFLGCNHSFAQMTGVGTPKKIISKTDYDMWPKKEADFFRSVDARVMVQNQAEYAIVESIYQQDGTLTWLETNKIPLHDEQGRVIGTLGTAQDITERIQAQSALQQTHDELELRVNERTQELATALSALQAEITQRCSAQMEQTRLVEQLDSERGQLEAILNSMTDGLIVGDVAGNVLTMNPAALRLHEYQSVSQVRRHLEEFVDTFELHYLDGSFMPFEEWPLARVIKGETFANYELQVRRIDTGNSWFASYSGTPVHNKAGEITLVLLTNRDITKRIQAEEALRLSFQRYRFLADTMPQIVWTARPDGGVDYFNQPWYDYTGMTFEQTKDWGFMSVLHPDDLNSCVEQWTKALQRGESYETEYRFKRAADETYRWHLVRALPMRQDSEIVQWVGTFTDIDDQKQAESELFRAHAELELRVQERTKELATTNKALQAQITERSSAESALQQANNKLKGWVNELEQRNRDIALLSKMSEILQACLTVEEAYAAIAKLVQPLFPQISGGIFLLNSSKNLVESVANWGQRDLLLISEEVFSPNECWALRRGRVHRVKHTRDGLVCKHINHNSLSTESLCVPMMAQGEALGVLYLNSLELGQLTETKQQLAVMVAEHIALSLANLKLRSKLQTQSIRDSLTGLFNRRYLEESLERELNRCQRKQQALGIIMIDVDHFKRFNDTFGHEAGDAVLRELGQLLQRHIRGSDIACRYGGEELTLILPEASLDIAHKRAEQIREGAKHIQLWHRHQPLDPITLSLGVACFPEHGLTGESVMQAADAALYSAKKAGRDAVRLAG